MTKVRWEDNLFELIRRTSTDLPMDVESSLKRAQRVETKNTHAYWAISNMLESAQLARERDVPICEDTGALIFYFSVPMGFDTNRLAARTQAAVARATRLGYLRENTIDAISGTTYRTNIAHHAPMMHFQQGARKTVDVRLVMKSAVSENAGRQYSLPNTELDADRDMEGVRRCVLDAVWTSQDSGCGPCVSGVCIGGTRSAGYSHATYQFLRRVGARSRMRALSTLENRVLRDSRKLGIGPIGLGGETTLLGVSIDSLSRLPSCYFVTVSMMGWNLRRRGVLLGPEGGVHRWLYA
jgi:fumarate hydratase class I